jgi:transposase
MRALPDHTPTLPKTTDTLRALLLAAWAERDSAVAEQDHLAAERDGLAAQNDRLRHSLLQLKRM